MKRFPEIGMALGIATTGTGATAEGLYIFQTLYNQAHHTSNDPLLFGNFRYDAIPHAALALELTGIALFIASDYLRDRRNTKNTRRTVTS